jgi:hypothetical protein
LATEALEISDLAPATPVARLARFFPHAIPLRLPVQLLREHLGLEETTVIEFGTTREVLFASRHVWEFAERLWLRAIDGALDVEASVVAVQYHPGQIAIAARFTGNVPNWIVKS